MNIDVLTYSEDVELAMEVARAGVEVAKMLGNESSFARVDLDEPRLESTGSAPQTIVAKQAGKRLGGSEETICEAILQTARAKSAKVILIGATKPGRVVAAKVAVALRAGSLGVSKRLEVSGDRLVATREVYSGKYIAKVASKLPCVALIQAGSYAPTTIATLPASTPEELSVNVGEPKVRLIEEKKNPPTSTDLRNASIIVSAGRGVSKSDDLSIVQRLAKVMGAAVGCSRPLSSDLGWLGEEHQVGLSGLYVHPRLYVAIGISGQLQHVAGIKDSKIIVAINRDKQAPIFQFSDYGIVGDLYQVVPALTELLSKN